MDDRHKGLIIENYQLLFSFTIKKKKNPNSFATVKNPKFIYDQNQKWKVKKNVYSRLGKEIESQNMIRRQYNLATTHLYL